MVRCVAGAVHDVALDLRPESATYKQSFGTELSATNGRALFMPKGIAHGFQTLADDSTLFYQMSNAYEAEAATGVPVDVVPSAPQEALKAPPDGSAATVTPNPGGCKATNPTLSDAARADWALWCDNTCAVRSNCATPELTGAAMCVCV